MLAFFPLYVLGLHGHAAPLGRLHRVRLRAVDGRRASSARWCCCSRSSRSSCRSGSRYATGTSCACRPGIPGTGARSNGRASAPPPEWNFAACPRCEGATSSCAPRRRHRLRRARRLRGHRAAAEQRARPGGRACAGSGIALRPRVAHVVARDRGLRGVLVDAIVARGFARDTHRTVPAATVRAETERWLARWRATPHGDAAVEETARRTPGCAVPAPPEPSSERRARMRRRATMRTSDAPKHPGLNLGAAHGQRARARRDAGVRLLGVHDERRGAVRPPLRHLRDHARRDGRRPGPKELFELGTAFVETLVLLASSVHLWHGLAAMKYAPRRGPRAAVARRHARARARCSSRWSGATSRR